MAKVSKGTWNLVSQLAFIAVILIGVALLIVKIVGGGTFSSICLSVANAIAYLITACAGFDYAKKLNNIWGWVFYILGFALIVVCYVLTLF